MPGTVLERKSLDAILEEVKKIKEISPEARGFPSTVKPTPFGKGLFASKDLAAGTVVERFEGQVSHVDAFKAHGRKWTIQQSMVMQRIMSSTTTGTDPSDTKVRRHKGKF